MRPLSALSFLASLFGIFCLIQRMDSTTAFAPFDTDDSLLLLVASLFPSIDFAFRLLKRFNLRALATAANKNASSSLPSSSKEASLLELSLLSFFISLKTLFVLVFPFSMIILNFFFRSFCMTSSSPSVSCFSLLGCSSFSFSLSLLMTRRRFLFLWLLFPSILLEILPSKSSNKLFPFFTSASGTFLLFSAACPLSLFESLSFFLNFFISFFSFFFRLFSISFLFKLLIPIDSSSSYVIKSACLEVLVFEETSETLFPLKEANRSALSSLGSLLAPLTESPILNPFRLLVAPFPPTPADLLFIPSDN
mmetsp:Transcript_1824/g.2644  ORF Transcript_1824/g.2644 Transcript_1824/m.2644 type:complete len:308 (-) Transcript_1824:1020-1943(-)